MAARCKSEQCNPDQKRKFKTIGDTAMRPILTLSRKQSQITSMIESFGLGAMTGLGSLIFSCTAYAKLQDDSHPLDAAIAFSKAINRDLINKESCADGMTGLAGLIAIIELEQHCHSRCFAIFVEIGDRICNLMCDAGRITMPGLHQKAPSFLDFRTEQQVSPCVSLLSTM